MLNRAQDRNYAKERKGSLCCCRISYWHTRTFLKIEEWLNAFVINTWRPYRY